MQEGPNGERRSQSDIENAVRIGNTATERCPGEPRRTLLRGWGAPRGVMPTLAPSTPAKGFRMSDRPDSAFPPISRTVEDRGRMATTLREDEMGRIIGTVGRRRVQGGWRPETQREIRVEREGDGVVLTRQVREDTGGQHQRLFALDEQNAIRLSAAILAALDGEN